MIIKLTIRQLNTSLRTELSICTIQFKCISKISTGKHFLIECQYFEIETGDNFDVFPIATIDHQYIKSISKFDYLNVIQQLRYIKE